MQDSFITIFKKINTYKNQGSFEGWMKRITINTALQKYREKSPLYLVKDEEIAPKPDEDTTTETTYELEFLLGKIQELPDRYRLIFNLYVLDNYSHKEISELLNISEGTSKSNLSRARMLLKRIIEEDTKQQLLNGE